MFQLIPKDTIQLKTQESIINFVSCQQLPVNVILLAVDAGSKNGAQLYATVGGGSLNYSDVGCPPHSSKCWT